MLGGITNAACTTERINLMAKKAELLERAAELKLEVTEKNTIAEIEEAIPAHGV